MRHLVTGGSGFIGDRVARRLLARGETVRILDLWDDPARPRDIECVTGSVLHRETVAAAMRGIDVVHHHAALVAQSDAGAAYRAVNVDGSVIVAEAAARAGVRAMVHCSSTAVYGLPPHRAITADTPTRPFEPYGRSKLAGERAMAAICAAAGIPLVTIRPRVTLGAGRLGIFALLFRWIAEGRRVFIPGDGRNRMQFVHPDDLIDFYMLALERGRPGTYNVGAAEYGTLRDDLEGVIRHAGSRSRVISLPAPLVAGGLAALYRIGASPLVPWHYRTLHRPCHFDIAPLLASGWKPARSNADMLREGYDWYLSAGRDGGGGRSAHRSPLRAGALDLARRLS